MGQGISALGDQFYLIALPWLVLQLTGDALAVGPSWPWLLSRAPSSCWSEGR